MNRHEIEAEINARNILLNQSLCNAVSHLEHVVGALLCTMDAQSKSNALSKLVEIETLSLDEFSTVRLYGEVSADISEKSKREQWREELAELESQLENTPEETESDTEAFPQPNIRNPFQEALSEDVSE
jgi:hypothetical protein